MPTQEQVARRSARQPIEAEDLRRRLFVLGAGFSAPAGLPLTVELLPEVLDAVARKSGTSETHLHRSLADYRRFRRATTGKHSGFVDIEEFATFMDQQHLFGMLGKDTWSEDGNRDQFLLRWGIGHVLHEASLPTPHPLHRLFAELLRPGDVVLTFNYDCLLEDALAAVGKPYRRFPDRFHWIADGRVETDYDAEASEVLVLKVHGSLDWVSRARFNHHLQTWERRGDLQTRDFVQQTDPVFGAESSVRLRTLCDSPQLDDNQLGDVYVIKNLDDYYGNISLAFVHPPLVLPPSQTKQFYGGALRSFWDGLTRNVWVWKSFAIAGFSLPPGDPYALQLIYEFVSQYARIRRRPKKYWGPVDKIRVVDRRPTSQARQQFEERYRFLPATAAEMRFDGLTEDTVRFLCGM